MNAAALPIMQVGDLETRAEGQAWMIQEVWGRSSVGMIGGSPKCCKSWLGLDIALSVASGTPCLDTFEVQDQGPALIYLAEDTLPAVRARVQSLCDHRHLAIAKIPLHVITRPCLRLDLPQDQTALKRTLETLRPRLLLLDPLVRMHQLDENSASEISRLLSFIRECQRLFDCSIILVHHASKKIRAQPGQSLRGSSDLHAFGDSNAYMARRRDRLTLTLEHRAAKAPDPLELRLDSSREDRVHLVRVSAISRDLSLEERILAQLRQGGTQRRGELRKALRVNNQRLGDTLKALSERDLAHETVKGWSLANSLFSSDQDPTP